MKKVVENLNKLSVALINFEESASDPNIPQSRYVVFWSKC